MYPRLGYGAAELVEAVELLEHDQGGDVDRGDGPAAGVSEARIRVGSARR